VELCQKAALAELEFDRAACKWLMKCVTTAFRNKHGEPCDSKSKSKHVVE
jgi:hypothetical protein